MSNSINKTPLYTVALVGISQVGYQALSIANLRAAVSADTRLAGVGVATFDFTVNDSSWWIAYCILNHQHKVDLVGFSTYCWNAHIIYQAIRVIKKVKPEMTIIVGGPEVGPAAKKILNQQTDIDYVLNGEGEQALPDVVYSLMREGDPTSIAGVCQLVVPASGEPYLRGEGEVAIVEVLDDIASPYDASHLPAIDGSAFIETFRGCPHQCAYCYEGKGTRAIRSLSWERIEHDIKLFCTTPGMRSFSFIDSVFNLTRERLKRLSDMMAPFATKGITLHTIEVDIESIDIETAKLLKRAGVVSVETGPQTIGSKALKACRRTFDKDRFERGVMACKDQGITVETDLIIGLPDDTVVDVLKSMEYVTSVDPGIIQVSTLHVLPGTELYQNAESCGLIFNEAAPHEIIQTADISFSDLRNLEVFGVGLAALYRAHI